MNLTLTELIKLSDALADKIDYMVQNGDGTDVQQNIDYANYKALFKKVNDEYAKQWVKTPYAGKKIIPLKGE